MDKAASPYQLYVLTNNLLVRAATSGVVKHEITRITKESDPARGKGWQLCPGFSLPNRGRDKRANQTVNVAATQAFY